MRREGRKFMMANRVSRAARKSAYLLINCSRPCLLSSMKDSSKIPSSPRKGSCRFKAFPGSGGTTICSQIAAQLERARNKKANEMVKGSPAPACLHSLSLSLPPSLHLPSSLPLPSMAARWPPTVYITKDDLELLILLASPAR